MQRGGFLRGRTAAGAAISIRAEQVALTQGPEITAGGARGRFRVSLFLAVFYGKRDRKEETSADQTQYLFSVELDERRRDAVDFYVEAIVDALCEFHGMIIAMGYRRYSTMDLLPAGSFVFIQGAGIETACIAFFLGPVCDVHIHRWNVQFLTLSSWDVNDRDFTSICYAVLNLCHLTHMAMHATVTSDCQNFQSLNMSLRSLDEPSRA
ncbi:hypothetical protein ALC57_03790 [Trachymyrmex cornetzi]|uniref:Uncharacterized protein n=1 Tax=Trachymyrmex cornetzi TaxID=471704 RepID=A0A195EFS8_9HYME|nr:hypothetical protein ALC57_03790 [Trachymyrmex cornetzi]